MTIFYNFALALNTLPATDVRQRTMKATWTLCALTVAALAARAAAKEEFSQLSLQVRYYEGLLLRADFVRIVGCGA